MTAKKTSKIGKSSPSGKVAAGKSRSGRAFLICGLGSSAGGLNALETFFRHMNPGSGIAKAEHQSLLPQLLGRFTNMPVLIAEDGLAVEPDHVYISAPVKK